MVSEGAGDSLVVTSHDEPDATEFGEIGLGFQGGDFAELLDGRSFPDGDGMSDGGGGAGVKGEDECGEIPFVF